MVSLFLVPLGLAASFCLLLWAVKALGRRHDLHPEVQRKTIHVTLGLVSLSFPFALPEPPQFLLAALVMAAILMGVRKVPLMRRSFGRALHDVDRTSWGEIYFFAAVVTLYFLARDDAPLYVIPLAVLAISDALAAVVGVLGGRWRYATRGGHKSWEGSAVFFLSAFAIIAAGLAGLTGLPAPSVVLCALCLAALTTMIEGASWQGIDNLLLPVATHFLLAGFLAHGAGGGVVGAASSLALLALIGASVGLRHHLRIQTDGLLAALVACYLFWAIAGLHGLAASLAFAAVVLCANWAAPARFSRPLDGRTVSALVLPALAFVLAVEGGLVAERHLATGLGAGFLLVATSLFVRMMRAPIRSGHFPQAALLAGSGLLTLLGVALSGPAGAVPGPALVGVAACLLLAGALGRGVVLSVSPEGAL